MLGPYVSQSFVKIEAVKQSNGDIKFFYNGSLATTTSLAQMPNGNCFFLIKSKSINTDPSVFAIAKHRSSQCCAPRSTSRLGL